MSKATEKSSEIETVSPNPIRVETALSRFPVHRLAKTGEIAIDIEEKNELGEVATKWEVNFVGKFKQPGPHAYKLDTIIINRRIEEAARPIPRLIRLGSLSEICRELGQADSGKNTNHLKTALKQNASAFITAKIQYRLADGTEEVFEHYFNRYSVVLKGEKLPDGTKADSVFIVLTDAYMHVINNAVTRPLDYEYLRMLPPAAQRFYELISFQMYATIKNDRDRAKILYSELCRYAPLTRQTDWNVVRPQLARIHGPHKESGYIIKIDSQAIVDEDGKPDWVLLYQPGPKARADFRSFAKRHASAVVEGDSLPAKHQPALPFAPAPSTSPVEAELIAYGVTPGSAAKLVRQHGEELVGQQIELLEWEIKKKPDKIIDYAAWLVAAINAGHAAPKNFVSKAERQRREEGRRAKAQADAKADAEARRQKQEAETRERELEAQVKAHLKSLTPGQLSRLEAEAIGQASHERRQNLDAPDMKLIRKTLVSMMVREHVGQLIQSGKLAVPKG